MSCLPTDTPGDQYLEDALEFRCYRMARCEKSGPMMFVTRDPDFPQGVHPHFVAGEFGWM